MESHTASWPMARSATIHCLTGCSIGEILGLVIGTGLALSNGVTVALSVLLAFLSGYVLSAWALHKHGLAWRRALGLVLLADTLSIFSMEITDNAVMAIIPGAMSAGLGNITFWVSMPISLAAAFCIALPVNYYLLRRGQGHALVHAHHQS